MPDVVGRLRPPRIASAPATPSAGELYQNTTTNQLMAYNGAAWTPLGSGSELAYAEITAGVAITATSAATANTIVTAPAFTFDGATRAIVEFYSPGASAGTSDMSLALWQDAASAGIIAYLSGAPYVPVYGRRLFTPAAGSRTYSIRGYVTSGTTAAVAAGAGGAANMPAYIRVSRA